MKVTGMKQLLLAFTGGEFESKKEPGTMIKYIRAAFLDPDNATTPLTMGVSDSILTEYGLRNPDGSLNEKMAQDLQQKNLNIEIEVTIGFDKKPKLRLTRLEVVEEK